MNIQENTTMQGKVRIITYKAGTKEVLRISEWTKNMIMLGVNTGKDIILDRLNADNTYSLNLTHADMGTGTTPPAVGDTQLQTAVARGSKATGAVSSNTLTLQFFFPDVSLPNGTYTEFGSFVDGSTGINTGKIFQHALFGTSYVKATGEDTTIELQISIS
jgi:hypothetical protein